MVSLLYTYRGFCKSEVCNREVPLYHHRVEVADILLSFQGICITLCPVSPYYACFI